MGNDVMSDQSKSGLTREISIFDAALKLSAPAERAAFLDRECGGDASLRAAVESLLKHHKDDNFMAKPGGTARLSPVTEKPGDMIGRYKLMEQIGEGGFGVVYVAEQREPVRRMVALKISKLGMDTRQVVARFEAERQALAMMDHPNIAKVLDGGATDSGRPYFVMELVRGIKVTEYCDLKHLTTRQRLDLFMQICRAVQHAHQKGVIHRDLKPSNILVTLHDGVPVPKVIDFGIAKATQGHLSDKTIYTEFQQFMGTPAYMSPEQAEMSGLDIDTRSDLYSLGVLLYELLTGSPPFEEKALLECGLDEMRRTIREKEPPRPSTRLGELTGEALTTTARRHGTEPPKLLNLVRGDLDWIVMKCLEKDRARRYESASGVAADIERHLNNEPIVARPPSNLYRLQKMVRRNKLAFAATAAVVIALFLGITGILWQAARAMRFSALAEEQRRNAHNNLETNRTLIAYNFYAAGQFDKALAFLARIRSAKHGDDVALSHIASLLTYDFKLSPTPSPTPAMASSDTKSRFGDGLMFGADGKRIICSYSHTPNINWITRVWDAKTGQPFSTLTTNSDWNKPVLSPDGKRLLLFPSISGGVGCVLWDVETVRPSSMPIKIAINKPTQFSPDGGLLLFFLEDETAQVCDAKTGRLLSPPFTNMTAYAYTPQFSLDGKRLLLFPPNNQCAQVWDVKTWKPLAPPITNALFGLPQLSPNGKRVLLFPLDNNQHDDIARVYDAETGLPLSPPIACSFEEKYGAVFSPDAKRFLFSESNGTERLCDAENGQTFWQITNAPNSGATPGEIPGATFTPNGQRLLVFADTSTACLWDTETHQPLASLTRRGRSANDLWPDSRASVEYGATPAFREDGSELAVWFVATYADGFDWHAIILDASTGQTMEDLDGNDGRSELRLEGKIFTGGWHEPRSLLITSNGWPTQMCEFYPKSGPCPDWVLTLAEAVSGLVLNDQGILEPTKLDRVQSINDIRAKLNKDPSEDDWTVWGRWLLADPDTRCFSPFYARNRREGLASHQPTNKPAP
jgi:serine/threonine protein kinase/WD40 repeat protein